MRGGLAANEALNSSGPARDAVAQFRALPGDCLMDQISAPRV